MTERTYTPTPRGVQIARRWLDAMKGPSLKLPPEVTITELMTVAAELLALSERLPTIPEGMVFPERNDAPLTTGDLAWQRDVYNEHHAPCFDHHAVACVVCKDEDWLCGAQHSRENLLARSSATLPRDVLWEIEMHLRNYAPAKAVHKTLADFLFDGASSDGGSHD